MPVQEAAMTASDAWINARLDLLWLVFVVSFLTLISWIVKKVLAEYGRMKGRIAFK